MSADRAPAGSLADEPLRRDTATAACFRRPVQIGWGAISVTGVILNTHLARHQMWMSELPQYHMYAIMGLLQRRIECPDNHEVEMKFMENVFFHMDGWLSTIHNIESHNDTRRTYISYIMHVHLCTLFMHRYVIGKHRFCTAGKLWPFDSE